MTIDKEEGNNVIKGPTGSVRGHRNRVIRSIQKIGFLSSRSATNSSCSSSASDTESDASSCSFSDVALSFTNSSSSESSAIISFEAEDSDVIRSLRDKWQRKKNGRDSGCSTTRSSAEDHEEKKEDEVILYTTSIGVIRSTFEASNKLRAILDQNFIRFEERDLFLDESFRSELKHRFALHHIQLPCVFVNGLFFGSMEEIEAMNETGILRHILPSPVSSREHRQHLLIGSSDQHVEHGDRTKKYVVDKKRVCGGCGGARFIPCTRCNGSTKSCVLRFPAGRHSIVSLKCSQCSRGTGLIRCPLCFSSTGSATFDSSCSSSPPLSEKDVQK